VCSATASCAALTLLAPLVSYTRVTLTRTAIAYATAFFETLISDA
jgi:hypothetical protein